MPSKPAPYSAECGRAPPSRPSPRWDPAPRPPPAQPWPLARENRTPPPTPSRRPSAARRPAPPRCRAHAACAGACCRAGVAAAHPPLRRARSAAHRPRFGRGEGHSKSQTRAARPWRVTPVAWVRASPRLGCALAIGKGGPARPEGPPSIPPQPSWLALPSPLALTADHASSLGLGW